MAHEVVFIPFAFLSLEPRRPSTRRLSEPPRKARLCEREAIEEGAASAERSVVAAFVSASHGHIVSAMQVCLHPAFIHTDMVHSLTLSLDEPGTLSPIMTARATQRC